MAGFFKRFRDAQRPLCTALVPAAGSSDRMGQGVNKLLAVLDGVPVLARTLQALDQAERVDAIVVSAREGDILPFSDLCRTYGIRKPVKIVLGGSSRTESVLRAALEADPRSALLAVHDGARPLATPALIDAVIRQAGHCGAAAPAVPLKDTIKLVRDGRIVKTPDRSGLAAVQTPQVFESDILKAALQSVLESGTPVTDDCAAVERLGKVIFLVDGEEENIKLTTPFDLLLAQAILEGRRGG